MTPIALTSDAGDYETVVNALGRILQRSLLQRDGESSGPTHDPDTSDFYLRTLEDRIAKLRRIRERFENCMTTSLVEAP